MTSLFTKIIQGELPGRFVWADELAVGFLTIEPLRPGHVLVVPRQEVDHWIDLEPALAAHLNEIARLLGHALMEAFEPVKVGLMIAGLEVRHTHLHVVPIHALHDLNFARADKNATPEALDDAAARIRAALRAQGRSGVAEGPTPA